MSQDPKAAEPPPPPVAQSGPIESRELTDEELDSIAGGDGAWGDEISRLRNGGIT
ncbi:hypothetical protein SAMN04487846_2232 [Microbacterium sp. cf046]|uniref:hypothetical protein n=1 Tax=Microbacterium sp. cf046 TaxID=1761803 RepID=UPI0008E3A7A1|nr:hypothetical protein [Microbacterium sp. cf046]SFS07397.1 hypothetical protein SAMN04487846_2232 [Microbacterium sp. cf046]